MTKKHFRVALFVTAMLLSLVSSAHAASSFLGVFETITAAEKVLVARGISYQAMRAGTCPSNSGTDVHCLKDYNETYLIGYYYKGVCGDGRVLGPNQECLDPCKSDEVRNSAGVCEDKCKSKENSSAGSFTVPGNSNPSGGYCYQLCAIGLSGTPTVNANGTKTYSDSIHLGRSCVPGAGTGSAGGDYVDPSLDPTKPPDGGGGGETGTCTNGAADYPTCTPPTTGTCANGGTNYPTCTPPTAGTCTNGGTDYPTCTAPGSGGSGGTGSGSGQAVCGGPGLPACAVNINESGPSNVVVEGNRHSDDLNRAVDARISGFSNETKVLSLPWSFTFSLPASTCRALEWSVLGKPFTFDPCPLFQRVREALAYLLYGLCAIYLFKRLTNAQGGF